MFPGLYWLMNLKNSGPFRLGGAFRVTLFILMLPTWVWLPNPARAIDNQAPTPILTFFPIYPRDHLLNEKGGSAEVLIHIDKEGDVEEVVLEKSTDSAFGTAALRAVEQWRFNPMISDGIPLKSKVKQSFRFEPSENSFFSLSTISTGRGFEREVVPIFGPRPTYPEELKGQNIRGHVDLMLTVDATGKVTRVLVEEFSHEAFRDDAAATARKWMFQPIVPDALYYENTGRRPTYVNPDLSKARCRLTLVYQPGTAARQPLDIRR